MNATTHRDVQHGGNTKYLGREIQIKEGAQRNGSCL